MHCRMFRSLPDLYLADASNTPSQAVTAKNVSGMTQCPLYRSGRWEWEGNSANHSSLVREAPKAEKLARTTQPPLDLVLKETSEPCDLPSPCA